MTKAKGLPNGAMKGLKAIAAKRREFNARMKERYSPTRLALLATAASAVILVIMLFIPSYIGVGNDSAAEQKLSAYGLNYLETDEDYASNEYFTRVYEKVYTDETEISTQAIFVAMAKAIDDLFTRDNLFDIRFLALIYAILYLPAVFLAIRAALERVEYFIEGAVLAAVGVLIFADVAYLSYFNSLYVDAIEYICLLYMAGAGLSIHREGRSVGAYIALFALAAAGLAFCSRRGALAAVLAAVFCLLLMRVLVSRRERALLLVTAVALTALFPCSLIWGEEEFDETDKLHAMTRGVLLESTDPVETLDEFGISSSYSILTDATLYDYYPISEISNSLLQEGFLDKYTTSDLVLYYLQHPGSLIALWNIGVQSGFSLRRDYCGNFEYSTGRPAMGQAVFFSAWSTFKERNMPQTLGYVLLLVVVIFAMEGRRGFLRRALMRRDFVYLHVTLLLLLVGLGDLTWVIVKSGDAALSQYNMVIGATMDLLTYYVLSELLHKLNVLVDTGEEK